MTQTVLIITAQNTPFFEQLEAAVLKRGFQTLALRNPRTIFDRLQVEFFAAAVFDAQCTDRPADLIHQISIHPIGAIIPMTILAEHITDQNLFGDHKTLLDQAFALPDITPEMLADYLIETIKENGNRPKQGDLSRTPAPFIFNAANRFNLTGSIICEQRQERKMIHFDKGQIVYGDPSQVQELCQPFAWDEGRYSIAVGQQNHTGETKLTLPATSCIYDGVKLWMNEERLRRYFNNLETALIPNGNASTQLATLPLQPKEKEAVKLLHKAHNLREFIDRSPLSPKETLQLSFILVVLSLYRLQPTKINGQQLKLPTTVRPPAVVPAPPVTIPKEKPLNMAAKVAQIYDNPVETTESSEVLKSVPPYVTRRSYLSGMLTGIVLVLGGYLGWQQLLTKQHVIEPLAVEKSHVAEITATPVQIASAAVSIPVKVAPVAVVPAVPAAPAPVQPPKSIDSSSLLKNYKAKAAKFYESGDLAKAQTWYEKAMQIQPTDVDTLVKLGNIAYDLDREADAMWYLRRALEINDRYPDVHLVLGGIYLLKNLKSEAIYEYKLFLKYCTKAQQRREVEQVLASLGVDS